MAKFEVLEAIGPDWTALPESRLAALLGALQDPVWRRDYARRRFGFREFHSYEEGVFAGYFVIESRIQYLTYDESGDPPVTDTVTEFERVLAIFLPQDGRWVLHERRFFRTDLNKPLVRDRFRDALRLAHAQAGLGGNVRLEPFTRTLSDTEMLEQLRREERRVTQVEIRRMHGQRVPEDFVFFNPEFDLNEAARTLFNHDLDVLDDAQFDAAKPNDIRESKIAGALSQAGAVESYAAQDPIGRRFRVRRQIPSTFELAIELDDPDMELAGIVAAVVGYVRESYPRLHDRSAYVGGLLEPLDGGDNE